MIRFILHATNAALILGMISCIAGAIAGLIVLLPFVAGAWGLNLMALLAYEENSGANPARQRGRGTSAAAGAANMHRRAGIAVSAPTISDDRVSSVVGADRRD